MKDPTSRRCISLLFALLSLMASAQTTPTSPRKGHTPNPPHITRFFIEQPPAGSKYETGPLHILYSDGSDVVQTLPPWQPSTAQQFVDNTVGFADVALASDGQTLGWTLDVENPGTSYPVPVSLVLLQNKRVIRTLATGQMIWSWMFLSNGKQVAAVFGFTHGPEVGDYRLYDVSNGKLLSEVWGDETTQSLKPDAPAWAQKLQDHFHTPSTTSP